MATNEEISLHDKARQDLLARQLSNSTNYDNAILTLSSGALGISLAFLKDIVPLHQAKFTYLLIISWIFFGLAIVSTITSFIVSQCGINKQIDYVYKYYMESKKKYFNKKSTAAKITDIINTASGVLFISGVVITVMFVSINLKGDSKMAAIPPMQKTTTDGQVSVKGGATIPKMQQVSTEQRGAPIPTMQPSSSETATSSPTTQIPSTQSESAGSSSAENKQ